MKTAEQFWDMISHHYDREEKKDEETYKTIIVKIKKHLTTSDIVLDYGCGTGLISNEIANNVKMIHAIDISSKMIAIAKQKADRRTIENIDYAHATLFDERYTSESFDVILAFYVLHLLEDTPKGVQRINELLTPGGLLISVTPCMGETRLLSFLLSLVSKMGFIPKIRSFKIAELEESIRHEHFQIVEKECLHHRSQQYFIVAKKI
jgi:2-polyprenyl-3-methyl-5-hydroxy-6-metoxy-1,4-benzoquinol methylase